MRRHVPALSLSTMIAGVLAATAPGQVFLPGTQPNESNIKFTEVAQCAACHAKTPSGSAAPMFSWQSGMMSQAMRDPVFRTALAVANQDIEGIGHFCLRCHTPTGFLEGRTTPPDASGLREDDLHGVSCEVCHRMLDPRSPAAQWTVKHVPPGYGNAMLVIDPTFTMHGPYPDAFGDMPHRAVRSSFLSKGQFCGSCHDVSNPVLADDVNKQPPHAYGHVEQTFSEWELSEYAQRGPEGSCQSCHYERMSGGGYPTRYGKMKRDYFARHGPVGGSTWVQDAIWLLWGEKDVDREALEFGKQNARKLLRSAASLELTFPADGLARLRITNLTGHKLPTGYPEGRRMWVNVRFLDAAGNVLKETGRYGDKEDVVFGQPVSVPTLLDPEDCTVYECLPAISEARAKELGKPAGPSFHFVLNDVIAFDNRIPPKGFTSAAFAERQCQPVGAEYADGQHWDDVDLTLPTGTTKVAVRLMYQSVSWEYLKFLVETDKTDDWGKRLYEAWNKTGRCAPETMAEVTREVGS